MTTDLPTSLEVYQVLTRPTEHTDAEVLRVYEAYVHLASEVELLRTQLDYWKEREERDPLPFSEEDSDE